MFQCSRSLKSLGRSVGTRNRSSIARQAMKDSGIRRKVVERMGRLLSKELTHLASQKAGSMLRDRSCQALEHFSWQDLLKQLEKETPVTLSLLKQCAHIKRRQHKLQGKGGRSSRRMPNEEAAVGMCVAVLMRARSQRMNLVQRLISMLLYGSHAPKQVCYISDLAYKLIYLQCFPLLPPNKFFLYLLLILYIYTHSCIDD